jgi:O-antigen/teichoic acid export membrane protein
MSSRARQTAVNATLGLIASLGGQAAVVAVQPLLLWHLGLESYGTWALFTTVTRYGRLTDFLYAPLTKYVAEYHERGDRDRVRQVVTFSLIFYFTTFVCFTFLTALLAKAVLPFFQVHDVEFGSRLLTGCVAYALLSILVQAFGSLLNGLGRLRTSALIASIAQVVFALVAAVLVWRGMGLYGLLIAAFTQVAVQGVFQYWMSQRIFGGPIVVNPRKLERNVVVPLLKVGGWLQISTLAELVGAETDQLIIAHFIGPSGVGLYEIGSKLARAVRVVSFYFGTALLPSLASIAIHVNAAIMAGVVGRAARLAALMQFLLAGFLFAAAPQFIAAYVGRIHDAMLAETVLRILAVAFLCESLSMVAATSLRASGQTRVEALAATASMVLKIGFAAALAPIIGIVGVLAATLLGGIAAQTVLISGYYKLRCLSIKAEFLPWFIPLALGASGVSLGFATLLHYVGTGPFLWRFTGTLLLIPAFAAYAAAFTVMLVVLRILERDDLALIGRIVPRRLSRVLESAAIRRLLRLSRSAA